MKSALLRPLLRPSLLLLAALACVAGAQAADLQVAPTSVALKPAENAGALWLSNSGGEAPLRAQVRVFRWIQENGEERLEATRDLTVSPPMAEVPAGQRQLVRIIRTSPPAQDVETAYRVLVDELPPADAPEGGGLRFAMRYSVPVFVLPPGGRPVEHQLVARLEHGGAQPRLVVANRGNGHAQLADLAWVGADGKRQPLIPGLVGYVLPGQAMHWTLPADTPATPGGTFAARINGELEEQTLAMDPAGR